MQVGAEVGALQRQVHCLLPLVAGQLQGSKRNLIETCGLRSPEVKLEDSRCRGSTSPQRKDKKIFAPPW